MINRDAEPIAHRSPYRRVDLNGRKRVITEDDIASGRAREPDPALYDLDSANFTWRLKE